MVLSCVALTITVAMVVLGGIDNLIGRYDI